MRSTRGSNQAGSWLSSTVSSEMALGMPPVTPFGSARVRGMAVEGTQEAARIWREEVATAQDLRAGSGEERSTLTTNLISVHVF